MKLNSTLQVGWYPICNNTSEHTYAIMEENDFHPNMTVYFPCYGGCSDSSNHYPVNFWTPTFWEKDSRKLGYKLSCHSKIARRLAMWGNGSSDDDINRTEYNRKNGGWSNLGDCSGIVYGVTGVCHQMCNTIASATNFNDTVNAGVNWPVSFNSSRFFYGNRGTGHDKEIGSYVHSLVLFYKTYYNYPSDSVADAAELSPAHKELETIHEDLHISTVLGLKKQLSGENLGDMRKKLIFSILPLESSAVPAIAETDIQIAEKKNELDNLLIRGQISNAGYAKEVNDLSAKLSNYYVEVLTPPVFEKTFDVADSNKIVTDIINPDFMPDYSGIKEVLGL
ncbi:hypothetical protein ABFV83_08780 [Lacrimispora sp. BS-2]|uniref:Uncharacterized protein n=1 Tax=Lacrimispora sp. BS-2 TaxID=3151850 RepID=A0AAU7PU95_9FIRM